MEYFEDIEARIGNGQTSQESYELTAEKIIAFCSTWDPLPFHTDEEAAKQTPIGRLFTSGIHTIAIAIKLGHQMRTEPLAVVAGLGWDEARFHVPVCAGDTLRLRGQIIEARLSKSRPD